VTDNEKKAIAEFINGELMQLSPPYSDDGEYFPEDRVDALIEFIEQLKIAETI
jgi:hypothetical protein